MHVTQEDVGLVGGLQAMWTVVPDRRGSGQNPSLAPGSQGSASILCWDRLRQASDAAASVQDAVEGKHPDLAVGKETAEQLWGTGRGAHCGQARLHPETIMGCGYGSSVRRAVWTGDRKNRTFSSGRRSVKHHGRSAAAQRP